MRLDRVKVITTMAEKEVTAKELAKRAGLSPCTISGIKSGRSCRDSTAITLAHALGVRVQDLM